MSSFNLYACAKSQASSRIIIIGGGAAGFFCAVTLSRQSSSTITILESTNHVLRKVRISGGGRCNVTSGLFHDDVRSFSNQYPRGLQVMPAVLSRFGAPQVMQFFENEGVRLKTEKSGKVFPESNDSKSIVSALLNATRRAGVQVRMKSRVIDIDKCQECFEVKLSNGDVLLAEYVVIATGSARTPHAWAERMGHKIVKPLPSLFTFQIKEERLRELAGVSVEDVSIQLLVDGKTKKRNPGLDQRGAVLMTHWGLSGPAVLSLSAYGARVLHKNGYKMECVVNWIPSLSIDEKVTALRLARSTHGNKNIGNSGPFRNRIPNRLWRYLVGKMSISVTDLKWSSLRNEQIEDLSKILHACKLQIVGKGVFKEEFVTAGGVSLKSIDTRTFESKLVPKLYFAGETLDIDGRTGGYNFQNAWSSSYLAAISISKNIEQTS